MKNTGKSGKNQNVIEVSEKSVDVLYQKMGNHWFAFSVVGDDVYVGSIDFNDIHSHEYFHDETNRSCIEV